jgi:hypothetical protein
MIVIDCLVTLVAFFGLIAIYSGFVVLYALFSELFNSKK